MALTPLATVADLQARSIATADTMLVEALLAAASDAVREAAGTAINETTATVKVPTPLGRALRLPGPVRSVSSVLLDGEPIADWSLRGDTLWRSSWQCPSDIPGEVTVTYTFGLAEVPADIVNLVCSLVAAGIAHAADGFEARGDLTMLRIDDYSEQYAQGADAVSTPMELPDRTRRMLAERFGGGATMVETRS